MGTGDRVRAFLKNVFNPLEVKQARAIDEIIEPTHRHHRLALHSALSLKARFAHPPPPLAGLVICDWSSAIAAPAASPALT
jgi:hypothetical protein